MKSFSLFCALLVLSSWGAPINAQENPYAALKKNILQDYDPDVRPGSPDAPIVVEMGLNVNAIRVEEMNIALHADAWPVMVWEDDRLKWDPSSFSGVKSVRLSPNLIWIPDIVLENEIPTIESKAQAETKAVLVYSNGTVLWVPSISLMAACSLDLTNFPRDRQQCTLIFGSWTYDKSEIDVKLASKPIKMDFLVNTSPWMLTDTSAAEEDKVFPDIEGVYPMLTFTFTMERRLGSYFLTLYLPIFVSLMGTAASWLSITNDGVSGAELTIGTMLNAGLMIATLFYHGGLMGISESGVPSILQFIGVLVALEVAMLPMRILHGILLNVRACDKKSTILLKPWATENSAESGIMSQKTADKIVLLEGVDNSSRTPFALPWSWARIAVTMWMFLAPLHGVVVAMAAVKLLP